VKQEQKAIAELRDALSSGKYRFRQTGLSTAYGTRQHSL